MENYKDEKEFFTAQTSGAQNWFVEEIAGFFQVCEIDLEVKDVQWAIGELTKDKKRNFLTFKDIRSLVGKDNLRESSEIKKRDSKDIRDSKDVKDSLKNI